MCVYVPSFPCFYGFLIFRQNSSLPLLPPLASVLWITAPVLRGPPPHTQVGQRSPPSSLRLLSRCPKVSQVPRALSQPAHGGVINRVLASGEFLVFGLLELSVERFAEKRREAACQAGWTASPRQGRQDHDAPRSLGPRCWHSKEAAGEVLGGCRDWL